MYGSREATKDVDAVIRQSKIGKALAAKVANKLGLPDDWLNDDVKQFLAEKEAKRSLREVDFGKGIRVVVPTAAYLLAMKLRACRPPLPRYAGDYGDIRFLVQKWASNLSKKRKLSMKNSFYTTRFRLKPEKSSRVPFHP